MMHSSSGFRSGGNRIFARPSGMTMRSMPQFSQRRMIGGENTSFVPRQFTSRTFSGGGNNNGVARFENNRRTQTNRFAELQGQRGNRLAQSGTGGSNRTVGNISPGHNHVFAQRSADWNRNWDRRRDHFWNGHRCRFVNGSWFIFDIGFFPWFGWPFYDYYAYDYYPYGYPYGYGYGDPYGYGYDSGADYGSSYYGQNGYDSSYDDQGGYDSSRYSGNGYGSSARSAAVEVADAQDRLARAGATSGKLSAVTGQFLLVSGVLLVFANVALGEGTYQRTRNGKTLVWNNHPKPVDEATWSGTRDQEGYARGLGTLTWYKKQS